MRSGAIRKLACYGIGLAIAWSGLLCSYLTGTLELETMLFAVAAAGLLAGRLLELVDRKRAGQLEGWRLGSDQETLLVAALALALLIIASW
ncbi:hypothetical protein B5M42_002510 [Paenibacillus athensensis]|uniref:hypothetical protein n=1 Tax=Paenibacillus athensensis TaxID=1967502 RepID=UPI00106F1998|nr:hypothetical protein [Paenibacillus athensensis]MCD1257711.1 hypothetical protein [Paenibacillus athensensis]